MATSRRRRASQDDTFKGRLRALRQAKGWTQQQLADATTPPLTQSYISWLETGKREHPRLNTLEALAAALGVSLAAFGERAR